MTDIFQHLSTEDLGFELTDGATNDSRYLCKQSGNVLLVRTADNHHHFQAFITGAIGSAASLQQLFVALEQLTEDDELDIVLDTPGGDVFTAIQLITAMANTKGKVTVIGSGRVQSAGSMMYAHAANRVALPGARFMYHGVQMMFSGKAHAMIDYATFGNLYGDYVTMRSVELGILTTEELTLLKEHKSMLFLTGRTVAAREAKKAADAAEASDKE